MAAIPPPPPVTGVNVVKGEGLVAQQRFERGALILTEDPLVMCDTGKKYSDWDKEASAFYQEQLEYSTSMLWKAFNNLELFDQGVFNTLYTTKRKASKLEYVVDAFRHNGFHFGFRNVSNAHIIIYRFICAAYHSCIPNATVMINDFAPDETLHPGQARLVATREIPAGSPIVIDYIPKLWKEDSAARQQALMARWGFDCNCEGCKPAKAVMDASERRICRAYHEKGLRLSAAELRLYIAFMSKLGKRDKDLSRLWVCKPNCVLTTC